MPNVTAIPRTMSNGDIVTEFNDTIGTSSVTYTYLDQQESLKVTNQGTTNLTLTVNNINYTIQPNQSQKIATSLNAFTIVSASGLQPFEARAVNLDTDTLKGHVQISGHRWSYNVDEGLRRWRAALTKVKAGTNQIINVSVLGDSISEGGAAGNGTSADYTGGNNYLNKGYVGKIRSALATKYGDVGTGFIPVYYPKYGAFWTFTGAWADETTTTFGTTGFCKKSGTNGDTATLTFSGTGVSIITAAGTGGGTFTVSVDGGAATAFDSYLSPTIGAKEFKVTGLADGTHTLTLTSTVSGGKQLWLQGAYPIKGTSGVRVNMVGRWGTFVKDSVGTNPLYYPLYSEIDLWSPALSIIAFTANDFKSGTDLSSYKNDMQALITRAKQYGDCLLVSTGLRSDAPTPTIPQSEYNKTLQNLAVENNIAFVDVINRWSGDANYAKNTLSFISSDNVHPGDYGHQDIATAILRVIDEY